jgi:uncharacterized protein (TIGR01244 family)
MKRVRLSPHITIGPQLSPDEWEELAHKGFRTVVNLSRKGELDQVVPEDEERIVTERGMAYLHFPVSVSAMGTRHVDEFLAEAGELETPMYIHCRLGQRSAPFALILHAVRKRLTLPTLKKRAAQHGLVWRSPFLNGFVERYFAVLEERDDRSLAATG